MQTAFKVCAVTDQAEGNVKLLPNSTKSPFSLLVFVQHLILRTTQARGQGEQTSGLHR